MLDSPQWVSLKVLREGETLEECIDSSLANLPNNCIT